MKKTKNLSHKTGGKKVGTETIAGVLGQKRDQNRTRIGEIPAKNKGVVGKAARTRCGSTTQQGSTKKTKERGSGRNQIINRLHMQNGGKGYRGTTVGNRRGRLHITGGKG